MEFVHALFEPSGDGPHPAILALHAWGANGLDLLGLAPSVYGGRFPVICSQGPIEVPLGAGQWATAGFSLPVGRLPNAGYALRRGQAAA